MGRTALQAGGLTVGLAVGSAGSRGGTTSKGHRDGAEGRTSHSGVLRRRFPSLHVASVRAPVCFLSLPFLFPFLTDEPFPSAPHFREFCLTRTACTCARTLARSVYLACSWGHYQLLLAHQKEASLCLVCTSTWNGGNKRSSKKVVPARSHGGRSIGRPLEAACGCKREE